jgi:hypothetical protein
MWRGGSGTAYLLPALSSAGALEAKQLGYQLVPIEPKAA